MSAGGCPVTASLRMPAGGLVAYGGISMDRVKQIAVYGVSCTHAEADFRPGQPCLWTDGSLLTAQPMVIFCFRLEIMLRGAPLRSNLVRRR